MRTIWVYLLFIFCLPAVVLAQTQPNYAAQVLAEHPAVRLDFNDATNSFVDKIGSATFHTSSTTYIPTPTHWWPLNGDTVDVISGDNISLVNGARMSNDNAEFGPGYKLALFDGSQFALSADTSTDEDGSGAFSFTGYFETGGDLFGGGSPSPNHYEMLVSNSPSSGQTGYRFGFGTCTSGAGACPYFWLGDASGGALMVTSKVAFGGNARHLLGVSYGGCKHPSCVSLYIDGVKVLTDTNSDGLVGSASSPLFLCFGGLGCSGTTATMSSWGGFNDVRYYHGSSLTDAQQAEIMYNGVFQQQTIGSVLAQQSGIDADATSNKSARFSSGGFVRAPDATTGSFEWTQPFSIHTTVKSLPVGDVVLASKTQRQASYPYTPIGWSLNWVGGQVCFNMTLDSDYELPGVGRCAPIPAGFKSDIWVTYDGTGNLVDGLRIYVNGMLVPQSSNNLAYMPGQITLGFSGGTGYADSTPFTVTGGGSGCHVTGVLHSTGGVPSSVTFDVYANLPSPVNFENRFLNGQYYPHNYGCTSLPAVVLTAPTGTGVTLAPALHVGTLVTKLPLTIGGDSANHTGAGSTINVDEFDLYAHVVSRRTIQGTFIHSKFYQEILGPKPANPLKIIVTEDGCGDEDNQLATQIAIAAHKFGYIKLMAVTQTETDDAVAGLYRELLDEAGLHHVPLTRISDATNFNFYGPKCSLGLVTDYNAAVNHDYWSLPVSTPVYRQIVAGLAPGEKIAFMNGGNFIDLADFIQAPADSISSLTGAQMWSTLVSGAYFQGLGPPPINGYGDNCLQDYAACSFLAANNGSVPLFWFGGTPAAGGEGVIEGRPSTSIFPSYQQHQIVALGPSGVLPRQCWDCLTTSNFLTSVFRGTMVQGQLVPHCCDALFPASGTGIDVVASTTSKQFFYPMSPLADGTQQGVVFSWFINSLITPLSQGQPRAGY